MAWQDEMILTTRILINDFNSPYEYSDDRIQQVLVVASKYVQFDVNLDNKYEIDVVNNDITPDPTNQKDDIFIGLVCLKAACIIDQSTFRTKAAMEGIRTALGAASLGISGNLSGYKTILETGPCNLYEKLCLDHNIGDASAVSAILSPFIGNKFDPRSMMRGTYRNNDTGFYP